MLTTRNILSVKLDPLSYVAIPLKILAKNGDILGICTGFLYEYKKSYYLITNWHNFTARNPQTNKPINGNFILPWQVEIPFHKQKTPCISWERHRFDLIDQSTTPLWLTHPKHKQKVDVVALKLKIPDGMITHPINKYKFDNYPPRVADNVFILGFPYDFKGGGNFPTWKHATIATEPDIDMFSLPQILVDTASRTGMSGSPVIFRRTGIHGLIDNKIVDDSIIGEAQNFLGIYSGRYTGEKQEDAQFGIIWKEKVIKEIIEEDRLD